MILRLAEMLEGEERKSKIKLAYRLNPNYWRSKQLMADWVITDKDQEVEMRIDAYKAFQYSSGSPEYVGHDLILDICRCICHQKTCI